MAYTAPTTLLAHHKVLAAEWNTDIVDNIVYLHDEGVTMTGWQKLLDANHATVTIANTAVETTIRQFSLAANQLYVSSKNSVVRGQIIGTALQNAGANWKLALRLKYGGTTVSVQESVINASSDTIPLVINFDLIGNGATNSQVGVIYLGPAHGNIASQVFTNTTATEDSTGALNVTITAQWETASASATLSAYRHEAYLVLGA